MLEWLMTTIKEIIANDWTQRIATFIGGIAVVVGFLSYLIKKARKNIPFTEETATKRRWFSSFQRRYNQHIIYEHRVFNVRGLRTQGTFTLKLEKVFVELRIAHSNPQQANVNPVLAKELAGNRPIWAFLRINSDPDDTLVLAVIGAPGCGKTTLLQHIALTFASKQQRRYGLSAYIPLLLFLRHHVQTIVNEAPTLADLAHAHFSDTKKYPELNPPPNWFAQQLNNGKCLILLDGLDEVADLEQRQKVSEWVDQQIINYPRCRFILTSRPQGYLTAPVERANVLEVQPFRAEQVRRFVHAWYLANEVLSFGSEDDGVRNKAKQEAEDLLQRLRNRPTLSALTVNPLLLTMIAMVHRYRGQLPGRRVELYAEICEVLLGHWRQAKGIQDNLTAAQKRFVLQPLAAEMMMRKCRDICTDDARPIIEGPLNSVGLVDEPVQQFLSDVQASSGLLLESEVDVWRFAHLTFQEYLAAAHLVEQQTVLDWNDVVNNSWWHETLRLYAAQSDATRLARSCLDNNSVTALTLAADCLEEARSFSDVTVRNEVRTHLIDDLESDEPQRRQLAAEVRLRQRLKSLQRLDEQREIDLDYISCAEYQLFLDEKRAKGEYYQPDHWTEYTFPNGTAQEPIRGVRSEDAEVFCEWLTQRQGGEIHYRLPRLTEIRNYPSTTVANNLAAWYRKYGDYSLNGLTKDEEANLHAKLKGISELPFYFHRARARARDRDFDLYRVLARVFDIARVFNIARVLGIAHVLDLDLARVLDLARNSYIAFNLDRVVLHLNIDIYRAIKEGNLQAAKQFAQAMQTESNPEQQRLGTWLYLLLDSATATTPLKARQAWRKYSAKIAEYAWIGYNELEKQKDNRPSWQRWLSRRRFDYNEEKPDILNLYWWLQLVMAREEGKLPAWEGIRIVRERELL
jgi:energy-coupling factor transporter ATP-binding protein EcfA2